MWKTVKKRWKRKSGKERGKEEISSEEIFLFHQNVFFFFSRR